MISVFVYPLLRCWDSWAERSLAAAHVADSNAIAARLQGPFLGVSLDALSLEAAEATRRDACEKSGLPGRIKRCPLPRRRRLRNWARLRGWIDGEASSSELDPSSRMDTREMAVEVHSLVVLQR